MVLVVWDVLWIETIDNASHYQGLNPQQLRQVGNKIVNFSKSIQLSADEQKQLDNLINMVVAPIDELIGTQSQQTTTQEIPPIAPMF